MSMLIKFMHDSPFWILKTEVLLRSLGIHQGPNLRFLVGAVDEVWTGKGRITSETRSRMDLSFDR